MQTPMFKATFLALAVLSIAARVSAVPFAQGRQPGPFLSPGHVVRQKWSDLEGTVKHSKNPGHPRREVPKSPRPFVGDDLSARSIPATVDVGRVLQEKRAQPQKHEAPQQPQQPEEPQKPQERQEQQKPQEPQKKPEEQQKPQKPEEHQKPQEPQKPQESQKPEQNQKPEEPKKPEESKPKEPKKPKDPKKSQEPHKTAPGETTRAKGIDIKSVRCNTFPKDKSPVPAVIQCIEKLAADNSTNCEAATLKSFCQSGNTFVLGWRKVDEVSLAAPSCKSVARSLGRIMDFCTHDGMVMGEATAWDDPATGVMIRNFAGGVIDKNMTLLH